MSVNRNEFLNKAVCLSSQTEMRTRSTKQVRIISAKFICTRFQNAPRHLPSEVEQLNSQSRTGNVATRRKRKFSTFTQAYSIHGFCYVRHTEHMSKERGFRLVRGNLEHF